MSHKTAVVLSLSFAVGLLAPGCVLDEGDVNHFGGGLGDGDGDGDTGDDDPGDGDPGDGDPGDGDPGDGDGDPTAPGDGDGDPTPGDGDGDPTATGDGDCDGESPYMGGWDVGCCQDQIAQNGWSPGNVGAGTVLPDWTFTDQHGDSVRIYDFCHEAIYFEYVALW